MPLKYKDIFTALLLSVENLASLLDSAFQFPTKTFV